MRPTYRAALLLTLFFLPSPKALACSCAEWSISEKFRRANLVFVGHVIEIKDAPGNDGLIVRHVTLKVEKRWKGSGGATVTLAWGIDMPGMCNDLPLVMGERYLIYSSRQTVMYQGRKRKELTVRPDCGPNYLAKYHEEEIRKLDSSWRSMSRR